MKRDYRLFINDIIISIEQIEFFVSGMNYDDFVLDEKTTSAVIRKLEIIGEASKNIPEDIKAKYENLPWSEMAKMRDKLIHAYFGVDYEIIWKVIKERLPLIKERLIKLLGDLNY